MNNSPDKFNPVKYFSLNTAGRDFVVGDIHGTFKLVVAALYEIKFDPTCDRLFSTGDLVDRGPDSEDVGDFLDLPWFHAVRGNHEQMALESFNRDGGLIDDSEDNVHHLWRNGMDWWLSLSAVKRVYLLEKINRLPFAVEIKTETGKVGIIHADIPKTMRWPSFVNSLKAFNHETMLSCLEGRDRMQRRDDTIVRGISRIFAGHTIQWGGLRAYGNVFAIDTGACFAESDRISAGSLTIVNIAANYDSLTARARPEHLLHLVR
jgi:serine/threonine protein phosphatase 1